MPNADSCTATRVRAVNRDEWPVAMAHRSYVPPPSGTRSADGAQVMPTLDAANIAFNLLKVVSGAVALGPILLGADKPVHIVTPSVTVRGLLNMSAIAITDRVASDRI